MKLNSRVRTVSIVSVALVLGALLGILLTRPHQTQYAFLRGTHPIAVRDGSLLTSNGMVHGTTTYFSFSEDWHNVLARALKEMPNAIQSDTFVGDTPAKVLTIPRYEDGRVHLFYPPVREITILPEHIVLSEGGQLLTRDEGSNSWAAVRISEYHQPHLLDSAVDWVRDHIDI